MLYNVLADFGFFDTAWLDTFNKEGGRFAVHLQKSVPGVEITAGSLGQGFGTAVGMALAARQNMKTHMVYAVLGDGELYEGSIWETAMFASHQRLNNLVTIIDRNNQCTTDFTENLIELEPLADRWKAFGYEVVEVDGHSVKDLLGTLTPLKSRRSHRPTVVIAHTEKAHGIPSMSYDPMWHGRTPLGNDARIATKELSQKKDGQRWTV